MAKPEKPTLSPSARRAAERAREEGSIGREFVAPDRQHPLRPTVRAGGDVNPILT